MVQVSSSVFLYLKNLSCHLLSSPVPDPQAIGSVLIFPLPVRQLKPQVGSRPPHFMFPVKDSYLPYLLCASSCHVSPSFYCPQLRIFWTLISMTRLRFIAAHFTAQVRLLSHFSCLVSPAILSNHTLSLPSSDLLSSVLTLIPVLN